MSDIERSIQVGYQLRVLFTRRVFSSANPTLKQALTRVPREQRPHILEVASGRADVLQAALLQLRVAAQIEEREMTALGASSDTREGVLAFLEKREPDWSPYPWRY